MKGGEIVNMPNNSDLRLYIKMELLRRGKSQKWLCEELKRKTGLFLDNGYLRKIFIGERKAPRVVAAICDILDIELPTIEKGDK